MKVEVEYRNTKGLITLTSTQGEISFVDLTPIICYDPFIGDTPYGERSLYKWLVESLKQIDTIPSILDMNLYLSNNSINNEYLTYFLAIAAVEHRLTQDTIQEEFPDATFNSKDHQERKRILQALLDFSDSAIREFHTKASTQHQRDPLKYALALQYE